MTGEGIIERACNAGNEAIGSWTGIGTAVAVEVVLVAGDGCGPGVAVGAGLAVPDDPDVVEVIGTAECGCVWEADIVVEIGVGELTEKVVIELAGTPFAA